MEQSRLETLTAKEIRQLLGSKIHGRASGYLSLVQNPVRRGNRLSAVIGKSRKYQVEATVLPQAVIGNCTCPYDWGGHCKHIGALLRYWVTYPSHFDNQSGAPQSALELKPVGARRSYVPDTPPDWKQRDFARRQAEASKKLEDWLQNLRVNELRTIGKVRGERVKGSRKDDIVAALALRLVDSAETGNTYHSLSSAEQALLNTMLLAQPSKLWHPSKLLGLTQQWDKTVTEADLGELIHSLHQKGVVLSDEATPFESIPRFGQMPPQLAGALLPHLPPLLPTLDAPSAQQIALADNRAFVRSASQLTRLIERAKPQLTKPLPRPLLERFYKTLSVWTYDAQELEMLVNAGRLSKNSMPILTVPPPHHSISDATLRSVAGEQTRFEWLYRLMVAVGVLRPGTPVHIWETYASPFQQQTEAQQQAALARAYFQLDTWSELWDMLHEQQDLRLRRRPQQYYKPAILMQELVELRTFVLRALATLPDQRWVALSALTELLQHVWHTFSAAEFAAYYSYRHARSEPNWEVMYQGKSAEKWGQPHTRFVQQILQILHWLGLADLALDDGQINGFRLQGLADLYWDRADTMAERQGVPIPQQAAEPIADALRCDGLLIQLDPNAVSSLAHTFLESIATLDQALADQFVYQLDVTTVHQAFEFGKSLDDMIEQWQQHFGSPPPDSIAQQLATWWDSYGQVRLHEQVTLIEFADEFALIEMKAATDLEKHLVAELSPTLVMITQESAEKLATQLQQAGYTPKLTERAA